MLRPYAVPALALALLAAPLHAQNAVTITGHVSSARTPLQGASVRVDELGLATTTNADGRYSLIIPSSRVQGQTVTLSARSLRYRTESVRIVLVGGSLVQDFELTTAESPSRAERPRPGESPRTVPSPVVRAADAGAGAAPSLRLPRALGGLVVDSSAFLEVAGPTDLPSALAGRLAGVDVQSSSALGARAPSRCVDPTRSMG